ncbi:MAG: DUF1016 domain-containing protein, partial [Deltaproteobacteria bacterium]|nr:DUF1016 domain-containing protein [Deltaproteobacteria bacterium]
MTSRSPVGKAVTRARPAARDGYEALVSDLIRFLDASRRAAARAVNTVLTATYWELGRRIVAIEQRGAARADYGEEVPKRLAADLTNRFGPGFSQRNLEQMRKFFLEWPISGLGHRFGHTRRPPGRRRLR